MSVQSKPLHWIVCDSCDRRADNGDVGYTVHDTRDEAVSNAVGDGEWTSDGVRHHCPDCPALSRCDECDRPAGDLSGERDYLCQACWDAESEATWYATGDGAS